MDAHKGHHTDCVVLSAANRAAFQGYAAEAAWSSVFEVVHRAWMGPMVESESVYLRESDLPPILAWHKHV